MEIDKLYINYSLREEDEKIIKALEAQDTPFARMKHQIFTTFLLMSNFQYFVLHAQKWLKIPSHGKRTRRERQVRYDIRPDINLYITRFIKDSSILSKLSFKGTVAESLAYTVLFEYLVSGNLNEIGTISVEAQRMPRVKQENDVFLRISPEARKEDIINYVETSWKRIEILRIKEFSSVIPNYNFVNDTKVFDLWNYVKKHKKELRKKYQFSYIQEFVKDYIEAHNLFTISGKDKTKFIQNSHERHVRNIKLANMDLNKTYFRDPPLI